MWKNFETKFNGILKSLARHKDLVECRASVEQYRRYRQDMSDIKLKLDTLIAEERSRKCEVVKEWLAVGFQSKEDHDAFCKIRQSYPSTGRWVLNHETIKDWLYADSK